MLVYDGPLSLANTSQAADAQKCFWQSDFMLSKVTGCLVIGTIVSGPIREYFWHFASTVEDNCWMVIYSVSAGKVDDS